MVNLIPTIVYAGRVKDKSILMKSSSGGAFTVLSDYFLNNGNAVVAAVYNYENHVVEYSLIHTKEERDKALGSKYMQSKPRDVFKEAYLWLTENPDKELLYVGMGCQADGFRKYSEMKNIRERICVVDIICHGSPSPKIWKEYAMSLEKRKGKITYLTFKDKRNGWKSPSSFVKINEKEIPIKDYVRVFYSHCALRPSCYECPYATTERKTDITIGDFWHIEDTISDFYDENGNSLFLIHTDRGEWLFESVKDKLEYRLSNTKQCLQANLEAPTPMSEYRDQFWIDYKDKGTTFVMKKYGTASIKTRLKNKIVKILTLGGNTLFLYYVDYSERRTA